LDGDFDYGSYEELHEDYSCPKTSYRHREERYLALHYDHNKRAGTEAKRAEKEFTSEPVKVYAL